MKIFKKNQFHISETGGDDYPFLAKIHKQSFEVAWSEDELVETLRVKGTICFVANIHGKGKNGPKGFLIVRTLAGQSEVLTIAIDAEFRKQGIARALMEHAIRQLHGERIGQLFLEVSEGNTAALNLYQSLNFKQISKRKAYYNNQPVQGDEAGPYKGDLPSNALVMQLELR